MFLQHNEHTSISAYELVILEALKPSLLNKLHIIQCMRTRKHQDYIYVKGE